MWLERHKLSWRKKRPDKIWNKQENNCCQCSVFNIPWGRNKKSGISQIATQAMKIK